MKDDHTLSFDEYDEIISPRPEECDFDRVVERALSRRGFLGGVLAMGSFAAVGGSVLPTGARAAADRFSFEAIPVSTADEVIVPSGYKAEVMVRWGDPLWSDAPEFDHATRGTAASQERAFGDNTDGQDVFFHDGHVLLVVNNEYTNRDILWGNNPDAKAASDDDVAKGMMAHGVTVVEIANTDGTWGIVKDSPYNRRITPQTDMTITGPAAAHDLMKTAADPTGTTSKGTWNNCGNGMTPWGTYLACEENFNGYFSAEDENHEVSAELKRYGVSSKDWGYGWAKIDDRFDVSKNPNEPNRAGYVVEIDPTDPNLDPAQTDRVGPIQARKRRCRGQQRWSRCGLHGR